MFWLKRIRGQYTEGLSLWTTQWFPLCLVSSNKWFCYCWSAKSMRRGSVQFVWKSCNLTAVMRFYFLKENFVIGFVVYKDIRKIVFLIISHNNLYISLVNPCLYFKIRLTEKVRSCFDISYIFQPIIREVFNEELLQLKNFGKILYVLIEILEYLVKHTWKLQPWNKSYVCHKLEHVSPIKIWYN